MITVVRFSVGRFLLHFVAMLVDHSWRFHWEGIAPELRDVTATRVTLQFQPRRFG